MSAKTTEKDLGAKKLLSALSGVTDSQVDAGIFDPEIARVAFINEFGSSTIPARPAMRLAAEALESDWAELSKQAIELIHKGASPKLAWARLGRRAVEQFRKSDREFSTPGNAAATIKAKGKDAPLEDTGKRQAAFDWRIQGGG